MTCIVGVAEGGRVWLGGDAATVSPYWLKSDELAQTKVFRRGELVLGIAGSARFADVMRYQLEPPAIETWDVWRWASVEFVDAARKAIKAAGAQRVRESEEQHTSFMLLAARGQLLCIQSDWQVCVTAAGYAAIGCACDLALGALHATSRLEDLEPQERIEAALEAAAEHSAGVRPPFTVLATPEPRDGS